MTKKALHNEAIKMLLGGATLTNEPCPYCHGVRVIKDGYALCIKCGQKPTIKYHKQPNNTNIENTKNQIDENKNIKLILNKKLEELFNILGDEKDYEKQYKILCIANIILEILAKFK
ncbi:MAG: hypothetical protein KAF24_04910 [Nitrosopumilaceae archaeon]|nr:hypothetical protein [Nitrosopumilaceae archaeon]